MDTYYIEKGKRVKEELQPICDAFGIKDWEYVCSESCMLPGHVREILRVERQKIGVTGNSISAILDELIGYIFISRYCRNRSLGAFEKQVKNQIKSYWLEEVDDEVDGWSDL